MTIYLDIIFLENIFMNTIILFATATILRLKIKIIRILISSIIGSLYAILTYISNLEIFLNLILKIILSVTMIYIPFEPGNLKQTLKILMIFYLTSFTFGGVAFFLLYFVKPQNILLENGVLIGTYPMKIILSGGILGFIIITIAFKTIKNKITKKDMYCKLQVELENAKVNLEAIIDTGNFLIDPISKTPVIVVEKDSLKQALPDTLLNNLQKIIFGKDVDIGEYESKIRIIPFSSLGKENGLLIGIKAKRIFINYKEEIIEVKNVIIGIYNGNLSKSHKYSALIGLGLLEENLINQ